MKWTNIDTLKPPTGVPLIVTTLDTFASGTKNVLGPVYYLKRPADGLGVFFEYCTDNYITGDEINGVEEIVGVTA
jgi:hypothetical protein